MRAADIRALLKASYTSQEWAIFFEVHDSTGARGSRSADAVAVNMWPSRGCAVHGFEVKVSRSDWLSELKNPAKADLIGQFCDFWNVVAPAGMVEIGELPNGWGLINVHHGKLKQAVQPKQNAEPKPLTKTFLAALLRRYTKGISEDMEIEIQARVKAAIEDKWEKANPTPSQPLKTPSGLLRPPVDQSAAKYRALKDDRDAFFDMTGIKFSAHAGMGFPLGKALQRIAISGGVEGYISTLENVLAAAKELKGTQLEFQTKEEVTADDRMKKLLQGGELSGEERQDIADWIYHLAGHRGGTGDFRF